MGSLNRNDNTFQNDQRKALSFLGVIEEDGDYAYHARGA